MNYYRHHLGDYDAATAHLTLVEDGAYSRLIRLYYRTEKPIPADINQACRLVRAASRVDRSAVEVVLREFFTLEADGWHQKRCDEELEAYETKAEKNRENGKNGGRPKKKETELVMDSKPNVNPKKTQVVSENNLSHKPLANSQEKDLTPPTPLADAKGGAATNGHDLLGEKPAQRKRQRKPATECPSEIEITDAMYDWANGKGLDDGTVASETEEMLAYHRAKGNTWSDWKAAWRTWMLRAVKFRRERNGARTQ